MLKTDKNRLYEEIAKMNDEKIEKEYYNSIEKSLGSQTDKMYDLGYSKEEIKEQKKQEKYLIEKMQILEDCYIRRKIKMWN